MSKQEEVSIYTELLKKLPPTFLSGDTINNFSLMMSSRVVKGKKEYPESYRFDPLREAMEECIDLAVYAMIMYYRLAELRRKLNELASKKS